MPFKVGIIGGGWYGCHIAHSLIALGFEVTVFERHERVLHEASGNNQFRLHLGFHYARHHGTRVQTRDGFQRFIERYPGLSAEVADNLYAVPKRTSLLDFSTYKMIMASSGIDYTDLVDHPDALVDIEGCLRTGERIILLDRARRYFQERLQGVLEFGFEVSSVRDGGDWAEINGRRFDYVIDATWGHREAPPIEVTYEPTMLLYYETKLAFPAITLVDGPLPSLYPTEDPEIFTLSSVAHTPLGRYRTPAEARGRLDQVNQALATEKRTAMERQFMVNVPGFADAFRFVGVQLAVKTKPVGQSDDRSCYVFKEGRVFSVLSGKIDTIFFATERILSMIEADQAMDISPDRPITLRDSILMPKR